jgi:hypothetical protein
MSSISLFLLDHLLFFPGFILYAVQICGGDIGGASKETQTLKETQRHGDDHVSFDGDQGESTGVKFLLQDRRN